MTIRMTEDNQIAVRAVLVAITECGRAKVAEQFRESCRAAMVSNVSIVLVNHEMFAITQVLKEYGADAALELFNKRIKQSQTAG